MQNSVRQAGRPACRHQQPQSHPEVWGRGDRKGGREEVARKGMDGSESADFERFDGRKGGNN